MKISTAKRQTGWLFTQRSRGVELGATKNKSSKWQGEGLEPGTTKLQIQRPNHLATPRPKSITPKRKEKQFAKRRLVLISFLIG